MKNPHIILKEDGLYLAGLPEEPKIGCFSAHFTTRQIEVCEDSRKYECYCAAYDELKREAIKDAVRLKDQELADYLNKAKERNGGNPKAFTVDDLADFLKWWKLRKLKLVAIKQKETINNEYEAICLWMEENITRQPSVTEESQEDIWNLILRDNKYSLVYVRRLKQTINSLLEDFTITRKPKKI